MFDPFYSRSPGLFICHGADQDAIGCSAARLSYLLSSRQVQPAVAPKAHDHRECGVSFGPWPSSTMASFDAVAGVHEVGYLNTDAQISKYHRRRYIQLQDSRQIFGSRQ